MAERPVEQPLVSVVIATNRGGPFLEEALTSVIEQTYPRVECILVDDGSPEPDVLTVVASGYPNLRVVRTEPAGVSAARNLGVTHTRGELLAFLDDDDRWHPDRLLQQVTLMQETSEAVVGYCRMRTIDSHGNELVAGNQQAARDRHDVIRGVTGIMLPNLIIRRQTFDAVGGFDPAYRQGEDLDLVLKASLLGPFAFTDAVLVDYRYHRANTTRSHRDLAIGLRTILRRHRAAALAAGQEAVVDDYNYRLRANDRFAAWSTARVVKTLVVERRFREAASEIGWAVRFAPLAPVWWLLVRIARRDRPT